MLLPYKRKAKEYELHNARKDTLHAWHMRETTATSTKQLGCSCVPIMQTWFDAKSGVQGLAAGRV